MNKITRKRLQVAELEGREVTPRQPKWVNSTTTQPHLPGQATPVTNLMLAGAHTKTDMDLWSIEAAVESGKRAAHLADPRVTIRPQFLPSWIRFLRRLDDLCFGCGAPQILDILALLLAATLLILLAS